MRKRLEQYTGHMISNIRHNLFYALKEKFRQKYGISDLRADLMSGLVVALVAIPLSMALGIASGVPPQHGLYTAIVAGAIISICGGSRFQVSGPTAAFVVILAPITEKYGLSGLLLSGLLAGIILVIFSLAKFGKLIEYIPYPVTTGFTAGIATVIATLQLKDLFGLKIDRFPDSYIGKLVTLWNAKLTFSYIELCIGISTLLLLVLWSKFNKKIPAPLIVLTFVTLATTLLSHYFPLVKFDTIGNRFSYHLGDIVGQGIPRALPEVRFPWEFTDKNSSKLFHFNFESIRVLISPAIAIALLGAIESLLSAVVADGMAQTKHNSNSELLAQGIGNVITPFFGGIPATGAIARTVTNIRFGAKSPLSSFFHAAFILLAIIIFAPYLSYLPMSALAALLLLVAYNMSEVKFFIHTFKVAPRSDVLVLLTCFTLTVLVDMTVGIFTGVILASLLFMRRISQLTSSKIINGSNENNLDFEIPKEYFCYEIAGPLFFGAARKAITTMDITSPNIKAVVLILNKVPVLDMTGLIALESAVKQALLLNKKVLLVGLQEGPLKFIKKSGLVEKFSPSVFLYADLNEAIHPDLC